MPLDEEAKKKFVSKVQSIPVASLDFYDQVGSAYEESNLTAPNFLVQAQEQHNYFLTQQHKLDSKTSGFYNDVRQTLKQDLQVSIAKNPDVSEHELKNDWHKGHFGSYGKSGYFGLSPSQQFGVAKTMRSKDLFADFGLTMKLSAATFLDWGNKAMAEHKERKPFFPPAKNG